MLDEQIKSILEQEEAAGMSHEKIGKMHGIAASQITRLLRGTRPVSGLKIETVQKMFPHATFNLNGDAVSIHADQNSGSVVGVNRGHVSTAASESFRLRILEAVIGLDIPADVLQIVLKTIKEIKP